MAIVGPDGQPLKSIAEENCPKCGRGPQHRVPSGGFGVLHMICICGYDFEGKIPCKSVTV